LVRDWSSDVFSSDLLISALVAKQTTLPLATFVESGIFNWTVKAKLFPERFDEETPPR